MLSNNVGTQWMLGIYGPVSESAAPTSADLPADLFRRAVVEEQVLMSQGPNLWRFSPENAQKPEMQEAQSN